MKFYKCPNCDARIFFENLTCLQCASELAYLAREDRMVALNALASDALTGCANRSNLLCNWAVQGSDAPMEKQVDGEVNRTLCDCCRYTRTIPPEQPPENRSALIKLEQAKRYLFYSLHALKLPLPDRTEQPETGLAFDFLMQLSEQEKVLTGHASGVITINIAEADDARREQRRVSLNEPYRTVLGHLRHEIGHFYWDQLVANSSHLESFRAIFGDERVDYESSLQTHYKSSNTNEWQDRFISRYASSHPWEDWAESWAHYLHIHDALDTAVSWQVGVSGEIHTKTKQAAEKSDSAQQFHDQLTDAWLPLSQYLNAACRSLGEPDAYPFTLEEPVIEKLSFIHHLIKVVSTPTP